MSNKHRQGSSIGPFVLGAVTGGIVGAAIALLVAPSEGSKTRNSISDRLDDLADSVSGAMRKVTDVADEAISDGFDEGEKIIQAARTKVEGLIQDADRTINSARHAAKEAAEALADRAMGQNGEAH